MDRHDVPPYWPVHRPLSDVTLIPVDGDTLRSAQSVPGWSGSAHPAHTLRPDLGWDDAPLDAQVRKLFESGGLAAASIVRIDAVVNAPMMCIFQNVRASMHIKLGRKRTREAWLWHGTAYDNLGKICTSGFDRSFGRVEAYGHGVYFAKNSQYSANPTYSPPDANGVQYMILSRVLVGEAIVGKGSYKVPQPKPEPRAMENFESFVNNLEKPSIVVSTRDFMAIPEFIIAFTNRGVAGDPRPPESVSYKIGVAL